MGGFEEGVDQETCFTMDNLSLRRFVQVKCKYLACSLIESVQGCAAIHRLQPEFLLGKLLDAGRTELFEDFDRTVGSLLDGFFGCR
jgi:hypothetical protein